MRSWRTVAGRLAASLLALALASERSAGPSPARADDLRVSPQVKNQVANDGYARVIVELRLPDPYASEGDLPTPAHVAVQRANLASAQHQVLSRLQGRGHTVVHQFQTAPFLALVVQPDALQELEAASFYVRRVIEDTLNQPMLPQSVPIVEGNQAWAAGFDGTGMVIAIVDTGVDKTHPFLAGKVVDEACFSSTVAGKSTSFCPNGQSQQFGSGAGVNCPSAIPFCWHGTHVAGIAAGHGAGAGVSYSGVAKGANIMAVQVFSRGDDGPTCGAAPPCLTAWTSDILAGLERVYTVRNQHSVAAVNLSVGHGTFVGDCDTDPAKPFIDNLRSVGIPTVIAAGNSGAALQLSAPSCVSSAVSVGSTDKDDAVSSFSNVAPNLSLFAPGGAILSSALGAGWRVESGTSMATPHVSGAWAILKQKAPGASVAAILTALQQTGVPVSDERLFGVSRPRIRIDHALATLGPPPPPVTHTLAVASENPNSGVEIAVSPADTGGLGKGTTPFSRVYQQQSIVTLTTPVTASATMFQKWRRDGTDLSTNPSVQITMDAGHTVTAVYVVASFVDVVNHAFRSWIEALADSKITGGCAANPPRFCPEDLVTRAQMTVFLLRGLHGGSYMPPAAKGIFADVPVTHPFAAWIEQLFAEGITGGCGTKPDRFCPDAGVTRDQMATLLLRSKRGAGYTPPAAKGIFADVPMPHPFAAWIEQLFDEGITGGCATSPLRYCPDDGLTRGQMAVFLVRAFSLPM